MLAYQTTPCAGDRIAIVGIGGAGVNILQYFGGSSAENVALYAMATDARLGRDCGNVRFVHLGGEDAPFTAAGGRPEAGRGAMERSRGLMQELLAGIRVLVLAAGLGGGTGSGAAPLLAEWAHRAGVFVVSVVIMPFRFEGAPRRARAQQALQAVNEWSDICLCFENDQMAELQDAGDGMQDAFNQANRILAQSVAAVPWIANAPGLVNLGLDDLATATRGRSGRRSVFGFGRGYGEDRVDESVRTLLESPLLAHHLAHGGISGPVLLHMAGGEDLTLSEIEAVADAVQRQLTAYGQELLFGTSVKPSLQGELRVTLIASVDAPETEQETGQEAEPEPESEPDTAAAPPENNADIDARVQSMFSKVDHSTHEPPTAPQPAVEPQPVPEPEPVHQPEPAPVKEAPAPEPEPAPLQESPPDFPPQQNQSLFDFDEQPPAPKAPQRRRTSRSIAAAETEEVDSRVRDIFAEIDNAPENTPRDTRSYSPDTRSRATKGDDIDTPPSLRFNDLSNLFPD